MPLFFNQTCFKMKLIEKIKNAVKKGNSFSVDQLEKNQFGFENSALYERMSFELEASEYDKHEVIRLVGNPRYKLLDMLSKADIDLSDAEIISSYIVVEDEDNKFYKPIPDIRGYNLFDDYFGIDADGKLKILGSWSRRHVIWHIKFKQEGKTGLLNLHIQPMRALMEETSVMVRLSIAKRMEDEAYASSDKLLLVFDLNDPVELMNVIDSCRKQALAKVESGKKITEIEYYSLYSDTLGGIRSHAKRRMERKRWGDAASNLQEAYRQMNRIVLKNEQDEEDMKTFFDICHDLGLCYYNRGSYIKAITYFELAAPDKSLPREPLMDCLKRLNDIRIKKDAPCQTENLSLLAEILTSCFQVLPCELSNLLWIDNETMETGKVEKQPLIWAYDVKELMASRNDVSIYLSYRKIDAIVDDKYLDPNEDYTEKQVEEGVKNKDYFLKRTSRGCVDKSTCQQDGVIILALEREGDACAMTVMIPTFQLSKNNNNQLPLCVTVRFAIGSLLSVDEFEKIREDAAAGVSASGQASEIAHYTTGKLKQAHYLFAQGVIAFRKRLWGDAIFYLTHVYRMLTPLWNTDEIDEDDECMLGEICHKLGFVYNELHQYEYALYYLGIICNAGKTLWAGEYINSLVNSRDIRAYGFLRHEYERLTQTDFYKDLSEEEFEHHLAFLRRRIGFTMVERGQIKDAKRFYTQLLDDPRCCEQAKKELEYIAEHYPDVD